MAEVDTLENCDMGADGGNKERVERASTANACLATGRGGHSDSELQKVMATRLASKRTTAKATLFSKDVCS